jgi:hypothetical protein
LWLVACGGGGGSGPATLAVVRTTPAPGATDFVPEGELSITFSASLDVSTLTLETLLLLRADGSQVPALVVTAPVNPKNVWIRPEFGLESDARYRLVIKASIRSTAGVPLGADHEICFYTAGPGPTVREDQILDLGDMLNVPRYLAQIARLGARIFVIGGFRSATEATDTVEEWDSTTRTFELMPWRMSSPRAEFTVTSLLDGRFLVAGGVAAPGGAPLKTTEYFDPSTGFSPGPPLLEARRVHAASPFRSGGVLVSGGVGAAGAVLDTIEYYEGGSFYPHQGVLPAPAARHTQLLYGFDTVWVTGGSETVLAAIVDSSEVHFFYEWDSRARAEVRSTYDGRGMVVAGDSRSIVLREFTPGVSWVASQQLNDRRGAFSLTSWGVSGTRYLAAGGFQISAGNRVLRSTEIVEYVPDAGGRPDAKVYPVLISELPVAMAGHVGFNDLGGASVLAGGVGDGVGDHLRRVVMVLDDRSTPPLACK